eukprot:GHVL01002150.1.p1 GENE.GHVL01002150.1~~GHVL01002150.1.p1  ORF type:complete len:251 (+),score=37.90 GHVL01002150.1:208-960(+)
MELSRVNGYCIEQRFHAKVPIIHWSPIKPGSQVSCDISVNNDLALHNSKLIGAYVAVDPRIRSVGMALKYWAKKRGINDRSRGTLSSFSILLMLIHVAQKRPVPILPSLQDIAISRSHPPVYVNGVDIRYCTDSREIVEELAIIRNGRPSNNETPAKLFYEFFQYYACEYKYGTISIRDTTSFATEDNCYLFIDNPFEVGKDVANVLPIQYNRIQQEIRRGYQLIKQGSNLSEIAGDDNVNVDAFLNSKN